MKKPFFLICAVFLILPNLSIAGTFYVDNLDPNCSSSSPGLGTIDNPWKNLFYATTHLQCGDTLYIRRGTYRVNVRGFAGSGAQCSPGNGEYSVAYFNQRCSPTNKIIVRPYLGETVILDGTSTEIDDTTPALPSTAHWTKCESSSRCGSCTGLALQNFERTYYSEAWNFAGSNAEQVWVDPQCNEADNPLCVLPGHTGTRLRWIGANYPGCANLNNLDGACNTEWSSPACGTFDTGAIPNSVVARLPDSFSNYDLNQHTVKIACEAGTCANQVMRFDGATNIEVHGDGALYIKYGYFGVQFNANASSNLIDGVKMMGIGGRDYGQCVRTGHGSFNIIRNSVCTEVAAEGIAFYGGGNGNCRQISGNIAELNNVSHTGFASATNGIGNVLDDGIIIKSCNDCVASKNTLSSNGRAGVKVTANWNATCTGGSKNGQVCDPANSGGCPGGICSLHFRCNSDNAVIDGNQITKSCNSVSQFQSSDCAGITVTGAGGLAYGSIRGTLVANNFISDILGLRAGIDPHGLKVDASVGTTTISNNSFYSIAQECVDTNENSVGNGNFVVQNNAFYRCNIESNPGNGYVHLSSVGDWVHANNTYWDDSNGVAVHTDLTGDFWRDMVQNFEPSALQSNPQFASVNDLHLTSSSPLRERGATLESAVALDIDGGARPIGNSWDIGADESALNCTVVADTITSPRSSTKASAVITSVIIAAEKSAKFTCAKARKRSNLLSVKTVTSLVSGGDVPRYSARADYKYCCFN